MPNKAKIGVPNISCFRHESAPEAIEWLNRAFGFEKQFVVPGENKTVAHAQLCLGPDVVPDIESHNLRAKAAGAKIERPLAQTEYGSREYSARDCDRHLWSFGTYGPYAES
jgi:uncharacterized glyoxalase superfamily protein PhnB